MNKVASRNILRGANKLVDTASSAHRVGRALGEINDDACFIIQPATSPIAIALALGAPVHQNPERLCGGLRKCC